GSALPKRLRIYEKECFILAVVNLGQVNRAAQRTTELITHQVGCAGRKIAACVHSVVSEELKKIAMQRVGSRACYRRNDCTAATSILRRRDPCNHLELADCIDR